MTRMHAMISMERPTRRELRVRTPSPESLQETGSELFLAVRSRLSNSPYRALRSVDCDVRGGTVTLRGRVRSYFLKQMAQHLVGQCLGIDLVQNELHVAPPRW